MAEQRVLTGSASRGLSAIEFVIGAALVIGHNVFRVVPNEVVILALLGLASTRLREGGWAALGFRRPSSWRLVVLLAIGAAALRIATGYGVEAGAAAFLPPIEAPSVTEGGEGNIQQALMLLALVWTFAAFGEEIAYRGYLTKRAADVGAGAPLAWWVATVLVAILFGYGHYYKGPAGIIDSGIAGLILGAAFLLSGRCLWTPILAHGLIDTIAVGFMFFGLE